MSTARSNPPGSAAPGPIFLSCVESFPGEPKADVVIRPQTGPEVLTGFDPS